MKVAMIGQKGLPATYGGVERHCEELGTRLVELGCDVTVFCRPYYSGKKIEDEHLEKINDHHYLYRGMTLDIRPTIPTKHLDAATHSLWCSIAASRDDFDLLHYHALGPTIFSKLPHFFGKPIVSTVHGLDWQRQKWSDFAKKVLRYGEKVCVESPNALIVVSQTLQEYFKKKYGYESFYIPNGIIPPDTRPAREINARWRLERDSYILFVGRLVPEKGCHYLIEAFKKLDTEKNLVIAGGASHSEDYLKKLKKMAGGDGRILFTGYVYGNCLDELFSNCYLYVHPSDMEGLPICLLEALSYGTGVLASDIPENMEVIAPEGEAEYGFVFKKSDVDDLREKLKHLLKHGMLVKEMAGNVEAYVRHTYNWDQIAEDTLEVYRMVLEKASEHNKK